MEFVKSMKKFDQLFNAIMNESPYISNDLNVTSTQLDNNKILYGAFLKYGKLIKNIQYGGYELKMLEYIGGEFKYIGAIDLDNKICAAGFIVKWCRHPCRGEDYGV